MTQPPTTTKDRQRALCRLTASYIRELDAKLRAEREAERASHAREAARIEAERAPRIEERRRRLVERRRKENF